MPVRPKQASFDPSLQTVAEAILRTVAYADVFDYPLTPDQIHRYLVGIATLPSTVRDALHSEWLFARRLQCIKGYYCLSGREAIVQTRLRRAKIAARLWPRARRYGLSIASLPFVRMVAVTGTLAVDNVDANADIDYLIVTVPHRVWLARLFSVALVHIGRLERVQICPNYVIGLDVLDQFERSFFAAHELAQMVPLFGLDVYDQLVHANRWAEAYLPNAFCVNRSLPRVLAPQAGRSRIRQGLKTGAEKILQGRLGAFWEQRERTLKIHKLAAEAARGKTHTAVFTPQQCKGHIEDHGSYIQREYARRLERLHLRLDEEFW